VEDWLQRGSALAVLMCVGAVVVVLVWSLWALPIVPSILTCLGLVFAELSLMHKMDLLVLKWKATFQWYLMLQMGKLGDSASVRCYWSQPRREILCCSPNWFGCFRRWMPNEWKR
jgi:hypothetical protein